jgi:hypothetical protein
MTWEPVIGLEVHAQLAMLVVTAGSRSLPLCSYPNYPRYKGGPPEAADSYESAAP